MKMSDEDKKRFIAAVTGADGKVNSKAAAALIAAAASGGDPEIANKVTDSVISYIWWEIRARPNVYIFRSAVAVP